MKYKNEYGALVQHSHFLRSSMNLAHDRHLQLENTMQALDLSQIPKEQEKFFQLQAQTAEEIGGVNARMLLDASLEIEKYHFGPLQIALSLLFAIIEKYRELTKEDPIFQDNVIDRFCGENHQFVWDLETLRNSILRQRYDNVDEQREFTKKYSEENNHLVSLLIEAENIYQDYLRRLLPLLRGDDSDES